MDDLLQQGITAYRAEKHDEARKLFTAAVKQNQNDERVWGWMYNVCDNDKERIHCLKQMLRINPKNEKANQLLSELTTADFPLERPSTPPINIEPQSIKEQKKPSVAIASTKQTVVTQKTPDPKQQKNLQVGIIGIFTICIICSCIAFMSSGGDGKKDYATMAYIQCTLHVENRLKSPSTADFPGSSSSNIQDLGNNVFGVWSYVDAQNSFGATIRNNFYCKIQYTGGTEGDDLNSLNWKLLQLDISE